MTLDIPPYRTPIPPRLLELVRSFPTLEGEAADTLEALAVSPGGHGRTLAVHFILSVWNPAAPAAWGMGRFDLHEAMCTWDRRHREAFLAWAAEPWWC